LAVSGGSDEHPFWSVAAIGLVAAGYYWSYAAYGNVTQDEGWLLECSQRVAAGQVPHRDFISIYPAGRYYFFAYVLQWFDGDLVAVRGAWCVLRAAVVALTFAIGRRLMPLPLALAAAGVVLVLPGPWHKTFFPLVPLGTLAALGAWLASGRRVWLVAASLAAGIGVWFRHDVGLLALGTAGLVVLATRIGFRAEGSARRDLWGDLVAVAIPGGVALTGGFVWITLQVGFDEVASQLLWRAFGEGAPNVSRPDVGGLAWWLPRGALGLGLAWLGWTSVRGVSGRWRERDALAWAVALVAVITANQLFRFPEAIRFLQCSPVFQLLWFAALAAAWRALRPVHWGVALVPALIGCGLPLAAVVQVLRGYDLRMPVEYTGAIAVRWQRPQPYALPDGAMIWVDRAWAAEIDFVRAAVDELVPQGDPIAVLGRPAPLYHLTSRSNPTRLIRFDEAATTEPERYAALGAMYRHCRYVVVDERFLRHRGAWWRRPLASVYRVHRRAGALIVLERIERTPTPASGSP